MRLRSGLPRHAEGAQRHRLGDGGDEEQPRVGAGEGKASVGAEDVGRQSREADTQDPRDALSQAPQQAALVRWHSLGYHVHERDPAYAAEGAAQEHGQGQEGEGGHWGVARDP